MSNIVLVTQEELRELIRSEIEGVLRGLSKEKHLDETILTRIETAKLLHVTLPTIHQWMNKSILPYYRMGSRVYFKRSEVMKALEASSEKRRAGSR